MKIHWLGNDGRCNPDPGTMETALCGVCNVQMEVERNVLGATSMAELLARRKHRYDRFTCPRRGEPWHQSIHRLKLSVYLAGIDVSEGRMSEDDYEQKKESAERRILQILEAHPAK